MITEDYVSYEVAKLLKEKGFDEPCLMCYNSDKKLDNYGHYNSYKNSDVFSLTAPRLQMAVKWIRNMHKMHIEIRITNHSISSLINIVKYYWVVFNTEDCKWMAESTLYNPKAFDTVEEAYENGVEYTLKNLLK